MAPIILGNASSIGNVSNIIVPYKDQYRISTGGVGGVAIGNTADTRVFSTGTVILAGTNLTISTSALGAHQYLNLSIADPAAAANYISAGDNVLLSTAGFGTTISVTGLQPAGSYLTTAALSDHDHGGEAFATGNIGGTIGTYTLSTISGTSSITNTLYGWSLSIPDFLVTAAESNHSHTNYVGLGTSTGTTLGTDVKVTLDTSGMSLRTPRYITTAANISHIHGGVSGTNITIGSSSNGLALSVGNYITTAAPVTHIHGSISTVNTTGTNISYSSASDGLTLGIPAWITTASGGNNLSLGGNTSGTLTLISSGTATIAGGNNITLSQDGNGITIIGAAAGTGGAGTGFSSSSITGGNIVGTLDGGGLLMNIPAYLTTAMLSNAGSNFVGLNTAITNGSMTVNSSGISIDIANASVTASNSVYAGDYISLSTNGINTTVSAVGLQATSNMSLYQQTSNNTLFLGTADANNFVNTAFSTLLQHTSDNSRSLATSQSSLFQLTSDNSLSLGTSYTSHTHSNLYIALSESSLYRSSVLSNTFAVTSHTHSNLYIPVSASTAYQTSILDNTFLTTGYTSHTHNYIGVNSAATGASLTANTSGISINVPQRSMYFSDANGVSFGGSISGYSTTISGSVDVLGTSYSSHTHSQYVNTSNTGSLYFANSLGTNLTWSSSVTSNSTYIGASINAGGGVALADTQTTYTSGTVILSAQNNIVIGTSVNGGSQYLRLSVPNNVGSMYFADSNGITFGVSTNTNSQSTITASVVTGSATGNYAGTVLSTATTTGANIVGSINTSGISLSIPSYVTETGDIYFTNSNGFSWGSSTTNGSTTLTQDYAAAKNIVLSGNTAGTMATVSSGTLTLAGGSNITLSQSGNIISILGAAAGTAGGAVSINGSTGNISLVTGSSLSSSVNGSTITFGLASNISTGWSNITSNALNTSVSSRFQLTADNSLSLGIGYTTHTHNYLTGYTETQTFVRGIGNAQTVFTSGSIILSASSNMTISSSLGTGASSNSQYLILSVPNNISEIQASNGTIFAGSAYLSGYNNITISVSNNTINFSVPSGGAGGAAIQGSGTYSQNTGTVQFVNSNGLTFGLSNNGVMTASVANNAGRLGFADSNGVTFGIASTASNSSTIVTASINTSGGGVAWGDGAATITSGTALLSDANNVSFGINGQTVTASIPAFIGTSVSTATTSGTAFSLSGNTAGITMTYPQYGVLNFSNANGHSFSSSVNGISTSIYIVT